MDAYELARYLHKADGRWWVWGGGTMEWPYSPATVIGCEAAGMPADAKTIKRAKRIKRERRVADWS